jgi:hypothetical protein
MDSEDRIVLYDYSIMYFMHCVPCRTFALLKNPNDADIIYNERK